VKNKVEKQNDRQCSENYQEKSDPVKDMDARDLRQPKHDRQAIHQYDFQEYNCQYNST
jgi:hypothetical protein